MRARLFIGILYLMLYFAGFLVGFALTKNFWYLVGNLAGCRVIVEGIINDYNKMNKEKEEENEK